MKTFPTIMLVALLSLPSLGHAADPAAPADYFNTGAERFINSDLETAKARVNEGLSNFPNDAKLTALKQLLEQQEQQQQQQQNQDQKNQQDKDQQKDQQQQDQEKKDQQQQDQEKQEQQKQDSSSPQEQQAQDKNQQEAPARPEELTPEDAKLLLDAAKENEQSAREQIRMIMGRPVPVEKDW